MKDNRIKQLREKHNLTLKQVAHGAGIDFTTLSKYENGVVKTGKSETWKKLADYFGVSISYLQNIDNYFDNQDDFESFKEFREYLKKRGIDFDNHDENTYSAFSQFELNKIDTALNIGNTDFRSLPDHDIDAITNAIRNLYDSLYGMTNKNNKKFYEAYLGILKKMSDLAIILQIVDENDASETFKDHVGFDRTDITNVFENMEHDLEKKTNIANVFDAEQGKFWDTEKQEYTDVIPRTAHFSQTEKSNIDNKI